MMSLARLRQVAEQATKREGVDTADAADAIEAYWSTFDPPTALALLAAYVEEVRIGFEYHPKLA